MRCRAFQYSDSRQAELDVFAAYCGCKVSRFSHGSGLNWGRFVGSSNGIEKMKSFLHLDAGALPEELRDFLNKARAYEDA